jgi:Fur family peroxide stress response transcriptional regulator
MKKLGKELREHSHRQTLQRQVIYDYLKNSKEHPTAEMVYNDIRKEFPSISLNTIYNTLELLEELGLAMRVFPEVQSARFDGNPTPHTHLVCNSCDKVYDLEEDILLRLNSIKDEVLRKSGFRIEQGSLVFSGTCSQCLLESYKEDDSDES